MNGEYLDSTGLHFILQIIKGNTLTQEEPGPLLPPVPGTLFAHHSNRKPLNTFFVFVSSGPLILPALGDLLLQICVGSSESMTRWDVWK